MAYLKLLYTSALVLALVMGGVLCLLVVIIDPQGRGRPGDDAPASGNAGRLAEQLPDHREELEWAERLGEVVGRARLQADRPVPRLRLDGQHHDRNLREVQIRLKLAAHLEAADVGEVHIQ